MYAAVVAFTTTAVNRNHSQSVWLAGEMKNAANALERDANEVTWLDRVQGHCDLWHQRPQGLQAIVGCDEDHDS
jgi:hypothetical protein